MWRWTIGIVVLIGLSIPVIALATDNAITGADAGASGRPVASISRGATPLGV